MKKIMLLFLRYCGISPEKLQYYGVENLSVYTVVAILDWKQLTKFAYGITALGISQCPPPFVDIT